MEPNRWHRTCHGTVVLAFDDGAPASCFPEPDWDDFVGVILGWWIRDARSIVTGPTLEASWRFMDGPFAVRVWRHDPQRWAFRPEGRSGDGRTHPVRLVEHGAVIGQLLRAADRVREAYASNDWPRDADFRALDEQALELAKLTGPN